MTVEIPAPPALDGVSRETRDRLAAYADILRRWQARINLVSGRTLDQLWTRHIQDCVQLHPLLPAATRTVLDLGSGAGLPGLILAILGVPAVHLVESDSRKVAFLREAARAAGVRDRVTLHGCRIEALEPWTPDAVTARALAPLPRLLALAAPFLGPATVALLPKGRGVDDEITATAETFRFTLTRHPSAVDPESTILRLTEVQRV